MKQNTQGSILVTAVVIIMIIMVLLGAALTIASSYYTSSVHENTKKQVYLSAKSSAEVMVHYIQNGNRDFIPMVAKSIQITNIEVEGDAVDKTAQITRIDEDTIKVVVEASFDDYRYTLQMDLKQATTKWVVQSYCEAKEGNALCQTKRE